MVFNFKQKFLAKGFREGGDSYYGTKGIKQDARCSSESLDKLYVEIDFTRDKAQLRNLNTELRKQKRIVW